MALAPVALFAAAALSAQTPAWVSVAPANNAVSVPASTSIRVTFDRALDSGSLAGNVRATGRWSGEMTLALSLEAGGTVLKAQPQRAFFAGETVMLWISRGVRSSTGVAGNGFAMMYHVASAAGSGQFVQDQVFDLRMPGESTIATYGILPADVNGDGAPDLVASNEIGEDLRILTNEGCANFSSLTIVDDSGRNPSPAEGVDLNGDGRTDIVSGNAYSNDVSVHLASAAGGFSAPQHLPCGGYVHGVAALDLDGDGDLDVAAPTSSADVLLFFNNGSGIFGPATVVTSSLRNTDHLQVGDANGDGFLDLLVGDLGGGDVGFLLGNGSGGFSQGGTQSTGGGNPWQSAVGDLDGDGDLDVVSANRSSTGSLAVHRGNGQGGFSGGPSVQTTGNRPASVDLGDLDGDGDLDCVVSCYLSSDYRIYWNNGTGTLSAGPVLPAPMAGSCSALVDYDRDGDLDIVSADERSDQAILFKQTTSVLPSVQPASCDATVRVDNLASNGGFGGRAAHPAVRGERIHFGVTAPPGAGYALVLGFRLEPGLPLPFGFANVNGAVTFVSGLGGGLYTADAFGEASVPFDIPSSAPVGLSLVVQGVVLVGGMPLFAITNVEEFVIR